MCFSPQASFAVAAGTAAIGMLTLSCAGKNKQLWPLAVCPLLFAVQQLCEGIVWLTLQAGQTEAMLHQLATGGFLLFASMVWPVWIPWSIQRMEHNIDRKAQLGVLRSLGTLVALTYALNWLWYGIGVDVVNHHLVYRLLTDPLGPLTPVLSWVVVTGYVVATVAPFCVSTARYMWLMGTVLSTAFIVTSIVYRLAFGSVWCFFAAVASTVLYVVVAANKRKGYSTKE